MEVDKYTPIIYNPLRSWVAPKSKGNYIWGSCVMVSTSVFKTDDTGSAAVTPNYNGGVPEWFIGLDLRSNDLLTQIRRFESCLPRQLYNNNNILIIFV